MSHLKTAIAPRVLALVLSILTPLAVLHAQSNYATPYDFSTFAGESRQGATDGIGSAARFFTPYGVATDSVGNTYVADTENHTIRKITSSGVVTTLAGSAGNWGSADGTGSAARFRFPSSVAADGAGNVYVADTANSTIRKITPAGEVTTLAGKPGSAGSTDGIGSAAWFNAPFGVAADSAGTVYVADWGNSTIRKITSAGVVTTIAGLAWNTGSADGTGSAARFKYPEGVAVDNSGNIYVADSQNQTIRKITTDNSVTTLAGSAGSSGSADGTGSTARFTSPFGLAVDSVGNLYVADGAIRKISPTGAVTTFVSIAESAGSVGGEGNAPEFSGGFGVAVDNADNVVVTNTQRSAILRITQAGVITAFAGFVGNGTANDGTGSAARFSSPYGVAVDRAGNTFISDTGNHTIRKISSSGVVTTLAGLAKSSGWFDGNGSVARFDSPSGLAMDAEGNIFVADTMNNKVRKITSTGTVTTLAANFFSPKGVTVDSGGNIYVADENHTIRKLTPTGDDTVLAGSAGNWGSADGVGSAAQFSSPSGLAIDGAGNIYVADTGNNTIRKITSAGVVTTFAGSAEIGGSTDGTGSAARFYFPTGIVVDNAGDIYVADSYGGAIRKITPAGAVTTIAGSGDPRTRGSVDGIGNAARFDSPSGLAVDVAGNIYVTDSGNNVIRKGVLAVPTIPVFALHPASRTIVGGIPVTLTALASGYPAPTYQWRKNGVDLDGETSNSYTIASAELDDAGVFSVMATNPLGVAASSAATLIVNLGPSITTQPTSQIGSSGDSVTFTVTSNAASEQTYQWQKDGVDLPGATGRSYTIPSVSLADAGIYVVTISVSGSPDTSTSNPATLTVSVPYAFSTFAGTAPESGSADGVGTAARFFNPLGVATDGVGNVYVADAENNTIRKITPTGTVTTLAGIAGPSGLIDGTGSAARFSYPSSVAVDKTGTLYVADSYNCAIRKITIGGVVTTFAGGSYGTADGTGSDAQFIYPNGVAVDDAGNVYVADSSSTVRKIDPAGVVITLAGVAGNTGSADGTGSNARFSYPQNLAVDSAGNVYLTDDCAIRKITGTGVVTTLAGVIGSPGSNDGTGSDAQFFYPNGLTVDNAGNLFVADSQNSAIRRITPSGMVTTFAGMAGQVGSADGVGSFARFNFPASVAIDITGNFYVTDTQNHTIRKITSGALVTTFAGKVASIGSTDAIGRAAGFFYPSGVAVNATGDVFVADSGNNTIRRITNDGTVTTIAGAAGNPGSSDGTGSAARFSSPQGVAVDAAGNVYVADSGNSTIRKITDGGNVTTLAGTPGNSGSTDGTGSIATFNDPQSIAVDKAGNVYVAGPFGGAIRKITPNGLVTTLAGTDDAGGHGTADGIGAAAQFASPRGITVDDGGNVYVADSENRTIRKITPGGYVTTLAGTPGSPGASDATGSAARFSYPVGLTADGANNIYVVDTGNNNTIRKITSTGVVTTLAGPIDGGIGSVDGTGRNARFNSPWGIAVDRAGNLYVADNGNHTIRKGTAAVLTMPFLATQPVSQAVGVGSSVILTALAGGYPAPTYQWQKNGVSIGGATGTSYYIASVKSSDLGSYTFVATNAAGTAVSNIATLNLDVPMPAGFDANAYLVRYPDVAAVFGSDLHAAWLHYLNVGIYDGEVFDELFRIDEYLALYPELFATFGDDLGGALLHWLNTGNIEGRLGRIPLVFSAPGYFTRNPDVETAVNHDPILAWGHYWAFGIYEGRAYDDELNVFEYLAINADLTTAFVNDWRQAALHWMRYGRTEGRLGRLPLIFNVTTYLNRNPDVAATWGTNPTTVFLHFWLYGIDEGRTFDDEFRVDEYLALNPDLAPALGTNRRAAFKHWVRYGRVEGRAGKFP